MNLVLVVSIAVRLAALVAAILLWRDVRDRRVLFLVSAVALMTLRQAFTLQTSRGTGLVIWDRLSVTELPGLAVSVLTLLAVVYLRRFIQEVRARDERLRRAETMQALGRMASGIAHDFNNVLTAVRGFCDRLGRRIEANGVPDPDLLQIRAAGDRGSQLVEQLMSLGDRETAQPCSLDLSRLVADMAPLLQSLLGPSRRLDLRAEDTDCRILADPVQMQRIVLNLVGHPENPEKPAGLEVVTARTEFDEERARLEGVNAGPYVLLSVREPAATIAVSDTVHLFEPFFTPGGGKRDQGLRLAILYAAVTQNGGHIAVTSDPVSGIRMEIFLPYVSREDADAYSVLQQRRARA